MSDGPSELQVRQLQQLLENLPIRPPHIRSLDGVVEVSLFGQSYALDNSDSVDGLLNDLMDVEDTLEADEIEENVLYLFDEHTS